MPCKSGGDPPHQEILGIVDRLPPKGLVAESALAHAGFPDPKEAAKKLRAARLDLAPSMEDPSKRPRGAANKAEPTQAQKAAEAVYTDEVDSGVSVLPPRAWYRRRRAGPTQAVEFSLLDALADISRRYHLLKIVLGAGIFLGTWIGAIGQVNKGEPTPNPHSGWVIEVRPERQ